jgi:hypothetical protein
MSSSIFLARLLGPFLILIGIAVPLRAAMFREILREFLASPVLMYLAGFLGTLGGWTMVLLHNLWVPDWRLLVTVVAWITLVRGLLTLSSPQRFADWSACLLENRGVFYGAALLDLAIGLVLTYFGFVAS